MGFRNYLTEAEWVRGQRYPTTEALWHVLQPLSSSNQHVITLGWMEGNRSYAPDGGPTNQVMHGVGVRAFMRQGMQLWHHDETEDVHTIYLMRINDPSSVWHLDPQANQQNPWMTMKTHWADMQKEYERIAKSKQLSMSESNMWKQLVYDVEHMYKSGFVNQNSTMTNEVVDRIKQLHQLVYVKAPTVLHYLTTGRMLKYGENLRFPKGLDIDVIATTSPIRDCKQVIIIKKNAVTQENVMNIPQQFFGFKRSATDQQAFYQPNAQADAAQKQLETLEGEFHDFVADGLNGILDAIQEALNGESISAVRRSFRDASSQIDLLEGIFKKIRAIQKEFKFPQNLLDAFRDFRNQAVELLNQEAEDVDEYDLHLLDKKISETSNLLDDFTKKFNNMVK